MNLRTHPYLLALALTAATTTSACKVGYEPIGGDGETGDGDGDPTGDGDGDPSGDGDGDPSGDGDGDCPATLGSPGPSTLEFSVDITENTLLQFPLDDPCTVTSFSAGATTVLGLDCVSANVELSVTANPSLALPVEVGDDAFVWFYTDGSESAPTWLRVDFPRFHGTLFLIEAGELSPALPVYFPAPYQLAIVDSCAPIDDGCAVIQPDQLGLEFLGIPLTTWAGEHESLELGEARLEFWNDRSETIVDIDPRCDIGKELFLSHRLMIAATGPERVEGEVCIPGREDPCVTGLHCCYPCGIEGCEFVCTPEDPSTMACPPPPP